MRRPLPTTRRSYERRHHDRDAFFPTHATRVDRGGARGAGRAHRWNLPRSTGHGAHGRRHRPHLADGGGARMAGRRSTWAFPKRCARDPGRDRSLAHRRDPHRGGPFSRTHRRRRCPCYALLRRDRRRCPSHSHRRGHHHKPHELPLWINRHCVCGRCSLHHRSGRGDPRDRVGTARPAVRTVSRRGVRPRMRPSRPRPQHSGGGGGRTNRFRLHASRWGTAGICHHDRPRGSGSAAFLFLHQNHVHRPDNRSCGLPDRPDHHLPRARFPRCNDRCSAH